MPASETTAAPPLQAPDSLMRVVNHSDNAFVVGGTDATVEFVNTGFTRMFGYTLEETVGRNLSSLLVGVHTDRAVLERILADLRQPGGVRAELLLYAKGGRPLWVSVVANPSFDAQGRFDGVVGVMVDITLTKMHEELQRKVLEAMVQEMPLLDLMELACREVERIAPEVHASILSVDVDGRLRPLAAPSLPAEWSQAIDGVAIGPAVGSCGTAAWRCEQVLVSDIATDPLWIDYRKLALQHGLRACWSTPIMGSDGRVLGTFAYYYREPREPDALHRRLIDASLHLCAVAMEREASRAHIHHLAFYDALTSLPNRKMLRTQAERALQEAQRSQKPLAMLLINVDRFKQINDAQGHKVGDELLRELAARLDQEVRGQDLVGRQAGDEFLAVLSSCSSEQALVAAERLLQAIAKPIQMPAAGPDPTGMAFEVNASIGVAVFPGDGQDYDTLLRHADLAMYQAKADGRGRLRFFSDALNRISMERLSLEAALRAALRDPAAGGLALHYQPQVWAASTQPWGPDCQPALYGVEALARWHHPVLGQVSPARFVPLAEECGLVGSLSQWALGEACRQMANWRARGVPVPRVAVNLSAHDFQDTGLPQRVADQLRQHGLVPPDLTLEMTEGVMMGSGTQVLEAIQAIHALGVPLSLDDFGTGYSSLSYLHRLPIHELKLDKSFVHDLDGNAAAQALTNTVLRIGDSLGLQVVAEGVETQQQSDFLTERGCTVLQGYRFSQALSAAQLEQWLQPRGMADTRGK